MNNELKGAYAQKLGKALAMEEIIIKNLPAMCAASTDNELRVGLEKHLEETRNQKDRLLTILSKHRGSKQQEADKPFAMMVENASQEIEDANDPSVRDAVIIAAAQAVEHHEIALYGTLIEWAKELEDSEAESLLKETLAEEKAADQKLTSIAEGGIFATGVNEMAAR